MICRAGQHLQGSIVKLHFLFNLGEELLGLHALLWCAQLGRLNFMLPELLDSPVRIATHAQHQGKGSFSHPGTPAHDADSTQLRSAERVAMFVLASLRQCYIHIVDALGCSPTSALAGSAISPEHCFLLTVVYLYGDACHVEHLLKLLVPSPASLCSFSVFLVPARQLDDLNRSNFAC